MTDREQLTVTAPDKTEQRVVLHGACVSHGAAEGRVLCVYGRKRQYFFQRIENSEVDSEILRFERAVSSAAKQLTSLVSQPPQNSVPNASEIFDAHLLILTSPTFTDGVIEVIRHQLVNAEWAVKLACDEQVRRQKNAASPELRERYLDIIDVAERVLSHLGGEDSPNLQIDKDSVLVAEELRPSTLLELGDNLPRAILTELGGWTSHTFIMARELGIPAIAGIKGLMRSARPDDPVAVDADRGLAVLNGTVDDDLTSSSLPGTTTKPTGGTAAAACVVSVNLDETSKFNEAFELGATGIGLLRSEYLFRHAQGWPSEELQVEMYSQAIAAAGGRPVRIRTFDFGIDRVSFGGMVSERNPALGLRGVRLGLAREPRLRAQFRALLQASVNGPVQIVIPMVSGTDDLTRTRAILDDEYARSEAAFSDIEPPRFGTMVEVPSAILQIDDLIRHADLACLGTNDLVQYTLAVDRDNGLVADWYNSLHPAVVRSIALVVESANSAGKELVVCGEIGGSPFYIPLLLSLGVRHLSVSISSLAAVNETLASVDISDVHDIKQRVLGLETAAAIEAELRRIYLERWPWLVASAA